MAEAALAPEPPQAKSSASKMGDAFRAKMAGADAKPIVPAPTAAPVVAPVAPIAKQEPATAKPAPDATAKPSPQDQKALDFAKLNTAFDTFRATSEARIKELESLRAKDLEGVTAELTATKAELAKKAEAMERFNLENDDRFKAAFDKKIDESVSLAKRAAGKELAAKVDSIFKMPPGEFRDEAFKALRGEVEDELDRSRLIRAYDQLEETQSQREQALSQPRENRAKLKELDQQNAMFQKADQKRIREAMFVNLLSEGEKVFPDLKLIEGNDAHNALVNEDRQRLRDIVTGELSQNDMGNLALYAVKGMRSMQADVVKDERIAALEARVQELTAAQPNLNGTGRKSSVDEKPSQERVLSRYHEAVAGRTS